ncbi:hypothetical protein CPB84DRAFT_1841161 [Gymnopilus junonius]|uniref:Uncharacterized protein n=1 Tax=Gymnopilus junonius TaxID=109634 RepID=A0A9P5TTG2_GYMJU|nr:hypothetical protein CPB84DRAFT_1841161 [Gymnopilus junonius]
MFVPLVWRTDDGDNCSSARVYCSPSVAIVASDPSGAATSSAVNDSPDADPTTANPSYINKPGVHRYIGIAMVIVMVVAILFTWLYYSKRTKDKTSPYPHWSTYFCCARRRKKSPKWSNVPSPVAEQTPDPELVVSEKERFRMLQSEPRGLIKEVSGGVVMYTEVPRPAMPKRERYPADWEFERVHGVRYEARTPHRHPERSRLSRKIDNRL